MYFLRVEKINLKRSKFKLDNNRRTIKVLYFSLLFELLQTSIFTAITGLFFVRKFSVVELFYECLSIMDHHNRDLSATLKDLENKYLISDGLMLNPENKNVLKTPISSINLDYDSLMAECIFLSEEDLLPGTQTKRISVEQAKLEFDARVKSWYQSVDSPPIGTKSLCLLSAPGSKGSSLDGGWRCSGRSSQSSISSFKRKENLVKLKLALFAKEKEKERSHIAEEAELAKQEAE